jgi:hypothetical protein
VRLSRPYCQMPEESAPRKPVDVYEMLAVLVEQLDAISWQKLGLRPDIMTGQLHQDLAQARASIDAMAKIVEVLEAVLDEDDKRRLQGMVRDLRINWVDKNREVGS